MDALRRLVLPFVFISSVVLVPAARGETVNCTSIASLPAVISQPGIYCLAGNLSTSQVTGSAIEIQANSVVLDLNGFKLAGRAAGVGTSAFGIHAVNRQNITIKNADATNHNIHPLPKVNNEWNESQPPGSADKTQSFPRQEIMLPVKCNIHPWMRAYINVVSHPFFAITGDDGSFTIKGLPPGTYTVEVVHEKYGNQEVQVTVGAKESKTADFTIKG